MEAVNKFTESAVYNVIIQVSFRASTFLLNALLLRYISRELLGVANVRLMLLYTTVSFFAREPFRRACSNRMDEKFANNWRQIVNLTWLCPLFTAPLCIVFVLVWTHLLSLPPEKGGVYYYTTAVSLYALAIFIETLAEPLFLTGQSLMLVKLKAFIEGLFYIVRQFLFAIFTILRPQYSLLNFGTAMVISSSMYSFCYFAYFLYILNSSKHKDVLKGYGFRRFGDLLPKPQYGIDKNLFRLMLAFWRHSFVKQLLTEGERYVMTFFDVMNFAEQGVYDVITNLGALVARIIFAPLEESGYIFFSVNIKRGCPLKDQDEDDLILSTKVFKALLKLVSFIGCIITVFGFSYAFLALHLYGGTILSSGYGPILLKWYSFYVVLLAINGITECFAFALMPEDQVHRHQKWLIVFCACFLSAALILTHVFGSVGFILANCINMISRIIYSCVYIKKFYTVSDLDKQEMDEDVLLEIDDPPLRSIVPNSSVLFTLATSFFVTALSNLIFCCAGTFNTLAHVAVGGVCLLAVLFRIYNSELEFVDFVANYVLKIKHA